MIEITKWKENLQRRRSWKRLERVRPASNTSARSWPPCAAWKSSRRRSTAGFRAARKKTKNKYFLVLFLQEFTIMKCFFEIKTIKTLRAVCYGCLFITDGIGVSSICNLLKLNDNWKNSMDRVLRFPTTAVSHSSFEFMIF